jgi:hypothetical protein
VERVDGTPCGAPFQADEPFAEEVVRELAAFYAKLSDLPFSAVGSLYPSDTGDVQVGPLVDLQYCSSQPPRFFGPFKTAKQRFLAIIDDVLQVIEDGLIPGADGVLLYLTQLEVRDLALASKRLEGDDDGGYYIKHADDKGDNVLRDGEGNIVGVIDWEW